MDKDAENVAETKKYSFLLGSAIRNEDPEQFLSIYDAIIPPDLPDIQIDYIKDKAREIADLPEEDFNNLVLNAREYSLAPDRKMSRTSFGARPVRNRQSDEQSSEEEEDFSSSKYQVVPPSISQTEFRSYSGKSYVDEPYNYEKRTDNDSGICNSSKATTSIGSNLSDRDEDSDSEDRRGIFDYVPTQSKSNIRNVTTYRLDYDEAHEVEDSDKNSQCDIESPRSDASCGTEMTTFRIERTESDDFETDNDSDDNRPGFIPHKCLYGQQTRKSNNYYSPMQRESTEEYSCSQLSFDKSKRALHNKTASSLRGVDESVNFPLSGQRQSYGSTSSDRVRVEKASFSRYFESPDHLERGPPFGNGSDQFVKVADSVNRLIGGHCSRQYPVTNMPEGRHISRSPELGVDNNKKKKKKKKGSKDDLEDKVKKSDYDENGNPCLGESAPLLPTPCYKQMRESPHTALHGGSTTKPRYHNGFPQTLQQFDTYQFRGQQVKDLEESNSATQICNQDSTAARKRAKKSKPKEKIIRAEEVENYVGEKNIEELVKFIENDGGAGTKKTNNKKVPASSDIVPTFKPTEKNTKKSKDKKHKSTTNNKLITDISVSETDIKPEDCELVEVISHKPSPNTNTLQISETTMGNSYARTSTEENGILTDDEDGDVTLSETVEEDVGEIVGDNKMCTDIKVVNKHVKCETRTKNDKPIDSDKGLEEVKISKKINNVTSTSPIITPGSNKRTDKTKFSGNNNNTDAKLCILNNSVKHNNTKNKVKADSHESGKDSTLVRSSLAHVDKIHSNNFSPSSTSVASLLPPDSYYIYTDLDLPAKEAEFTVVGKKKKRPITTTAKDSSNTANVSKDIAQLPLRQPPRADRPRKPVTRSVTPPPLNSLSAKDTVERLRDLSPSSFPALNSPSPSLGRDGRRNSTGDVPTEIVLKIQDDSDMESVKSLPASQGGCGTHQAVSPKMPVSYAKIAASPKPSNTCLTGNRSSESADDSENMEWKSAVWKGSPTERRHSIGSSPENSSIKETELSPSVRQKFGSQEALVISTSITGDKEQIVAVATSSDSQLCVSVTNEIIDSKSEVISCAVIGSASAPCVLSDDSVEKDTSVLNTSHHKVTGSLSEVINHPSVQPPAMEVCSVPQEVRHGEPITDSISGASLKDSSSDHKIDTKHVPPKHSANASRKNKTKSVIFLDKRLNQVPKNLGITFGFELGVDMNSMKEPEGDGISFIANESCVSTTSVPLPQLKESSSGKKTVNSCCSSVIVSHSQMNPSTGSDNKPNPEFSKDSKPLSHQHSLAGKNGVVLPKALDMPGEPLDFFHSDQMSKFTVESTISCDLEFSKDNKPLPNLLVVCYGEFTSEFSESFHVSDEMKCYKQVGFLPEETIDKAKFNQDEVVSYIKKEWERISHLKEKEPESVIVYNSQTKGDN